MDLVIIRENEEDFYTGIEYQQTPEVCQALKIISSPGCERIIRYAFEYACRYGRKKVTAFTKDNILKLSDGLFHKIFDTIAIEYPQIENEHWLIDIGTAKIADTPEEFDVVVMPNLYGDIVSDVTAQISGSVGLVGTANIGDKGAMFEAIHGSAPRLAGQNVANPTGLLLGAILMLVHIQQPEVATTIHNALLRTIEEGIHTKDIFTQGCSREKVGTQEFGEAIIKRLGKKPETLSPISYQKQPPSSSSSRSLPPSKADRGLVGVDIFLYSPQPIDSFRSIVEKGNTPDLQLRLITNRGTKIWPEGTPDTNCVDHWRCRFQGTKGIVTYTQILILLQRLTEAGVDIIQTQNLYTFDNKPGYSNVEG
jgi:isocitrate dehydrogenase